MPCKIGNCASWAKLNQDCELLVCRPTLDVDFENNITGWRKGPYAMGTTSSVGQATGNQIKEAFLIFLQTNIFIETYKVARYESSLLMPS